MASDIKPISGLYHNGKGAKSPRNLKRFDDKDFLAHVLGENRYLKMIINSTSYESKSRYNYT